MSKAVWYFRVMKSINRLEDSWTPSWDLGLQDEFGFCLEVEAAEEPRLSEKRSNAWAMASREVLNRQSSSANRLSNWDASKQELVSFLENLSVELANDG